MSLNCWFIIMLVSLVIVRMCWCVGGYYVGEWYCWIVCMWCGSCVSGSCVLICFFGCGIFVYFCCVMWWVSVVYSNVCLLLCYRNYSVFVICLYIIINLLCMNWWWLFGVYIVCCCSWNRFCVGNIVFGLFNDVVGVMCFVVVEWFWLIGYVIVVYMDYECFIFYFIKRF